VTRDETEKMYLDYVNNFLTLSAFAEHYKISLTEAYYIIEEGREIRAHNKRYR